MNIGLRSVAFRVIALSTGWAVLALIVIATLISTLYRRTSERGFESLLSAHLFNLVGSVSISGAGDLTGSPDLGDIRFTIPDSGWYWSVTPVSSGLKGQPLESLSMTDDITSPSVQKVPFNGEFRRHYIIRGPSGNKLEAFESEIVLGAGNQVARFRVTGNRSELEKAISRFEDRLNAYLALFGLGMIAINVAAIMLGLRPLDKVRDALAKVREGKAARLDGRFPAEIEPLVNETNALIENNRHIVDRARTQVGNLAHSLKTPIAVLVNESRTIGGPKGRLVADHAASMQLQVDHYLRRARIAAQRDSVAFRTPLRPLLERLARVMEKLNHGKRIALMFPDGDLSFAGEAEDFEEIVGNLLENAVKWANMAVRITIENPARRQPSGMFSVAIEDDGPGIPEKKLSTVIERGKRLDETKPGSGLGLSIVSDLVREYEGQLDLQPSEMGGLKAVVCLRCAL